LYFSSCKMLYKFHRSLKKLYLKRLLTFKVFLTDCNELYKGYLIPVRLQKSLFSSHLSLEKPVNSIKGI
jgi:hypothetical protein